MKHRYLNGTVESDDIRKQVHVTGVNFIHSTARAIYDQETKWGIQDHDVLTWLAIVFEEVGEVAKSVLEGNAAEARTEIAQTGACLVQLLAKIDRLEEETGVE